MQTIRLYKETKRYSISFAFCFKFLSSFPNKFIVTIEFVLFFSLALFRFLFSAQTTCKHYDSLFLFCVLFVVASLFAFAFVRHYVVFCRLGMMLIMRGFDTALHFLMHFLMFLVVSSALTSSNSLHFCICCFLGVNVKFHHMQMNLHMPHFNEIQ